MEVPGPDGDLRERAGQGGQVLARAALGRRELALVVLPTLLLLAVIPFDLDPWLRGPAPYPPEWQWGFRGPPEGGRWWPAALVGTALLSLVAASFTARARARPRAAAAILLAAGVALGWGYQLALLQIESAGTLRTLLSRTLSRTFTSYHTVALSPEAQDPIAFLRAHADLLADFKATAKHAATHPPGPVLFYRGVIGLCGRWPALTRRVLLAAGDPDERASRPAHAAALLGAMILGLLGAATAWPVAALARAAGADPLAAARAGILWGLLPGPALMTPQFDQALALPVAATAALLASAVTGEQARAKAVMAGLCAAVAVFVSYGAAAFLLIAAAAALSLGSSLRRSVQVGAIAGLTAAGVLGLTALLGHQPLRSALTALAVHREVYTAPRSYTLWLLFNPLDLAVFVGPPVAILFGLRGHRMRTAVAVGLALLLLSGATRGEVGRIWIPIMPLLLVPALGDEKPWPLVVGALLVPLAIVIRAFWTL